MSSAVQDTSSMARVAPSGLLLGAFALSGMASLVFEVSWTRTLATVMGSSTYAMSTVLAAFLFGLAVGSLWAAARASRVTDPVLAFALCELGVGASGVLINPIIKSLTPLYISGYYAFHQSFAGFSALQFAIAFGVMGVPTLLMGAGFPFVVRGLAAGQADTVPAAARAYSLNTFGAVAGALVAGFLLVPLLGTSRAAIAAAAVNVVTALALLLLRRRVATAAVGLLVALLALGGASLFRPLPAPFFSFAAASRFGTAEAALKIAEAIERQQELAVLYHHEGVEGDVAVLASADPRQRQAYTLINNGKLEGGEAPGFVLLGALPYATHALLGPTHVALNIGLGSGRTLSTLAAYPFERLDSVELSDGVLEANRQFLSPALFEDQRIHHVLADGRNFLLLSRERYDVIVVSPSWATELASAGLLTDEFLSLAAGHLAPEGVVALWVDFSMLSDEDMSLLLRTFAKNFRHVTAWRVGGDDVVIVGANSERFPSEADVAARVAEQSPQLREQFEVALSDAAPHPGAFDDVNSDEHPRLEFDNARAFLRGGAPGQPRAESP